MCLSLFLAQVLGFYLGFIGLGLLINQAHYKKVFTETLNNHALIAFTGFLGMLIGLLVVLTHNIWVTDWPVVITLVGWIFLLQGILRIVFPDFFVKMMKELQMRVGGLLFAWIMLLIGLYLLWAGFSQSCGY